MNFKSVAKFISIIGMTLGGFFLLDILIGLIYSENVIRFLVFIGIFFLVNLSIWLGLKNHQIDLKVKDSILSVNLIWILLGIGGAIPLYLYTNISFASAFFEAISGFTTTGATIYKDIESLPHMILFHRSLMHWLGGMGIIVLGVGLLSMINPTGGLSLFKAESTGVSIEKLTPKIKDTALTLWIVYMSLTLLDFLFLKMFGMSWFDAINHAFSTISTGGFSTKNASLGYYSNDGIIWTTTIFMLFSGVNFLAHIKLFRGDGSGYRSEEVRWYFSLFFILSIGLSLVHFYTSDISLGNSIRNSFFTISSVMTTTGFATVDYALWGHFAVGIIFFAMFVGGNAGSTAGGVKVIRYVIIFKTIFSEFKRILHPNSIVNVFIDGVKIKDNILMGTFAFFILYILTTIMLSIYIYAKGFDAMTSISGALAIVGNIGPGFSKVDPSCNFSFFSDFDKIVLSFGMIIGRLECFTFFIIFSKGFWKKF